MLVPALAVAAALLAHDGPQRASLRNNGNQLQRDSTANGVSADGRYVLFTTTGNATSDPDANGGTWDTYRRDLELGVTELVSINAAGTATGDGASVGGTLSADGRYVAFTSSATDLVPGDTNGVSDAFLRDMETGVTTRLSLLPGGGQATQSTGRAQISGDGRYVFIRTFEPMLPGDTNMTRDIYRLELASGQFEPVSADATGAVGNALSFDYDVSFDGRYAAFMSSATNLGPTDNNNLPDVYWKDVETGEVRLISVSPAGIQTNNFSDTPAISGDGSVVAFSSLAGDLLPFDTNNAMDTFVVEVATGAIERIDLLPNGFESGGGDYQFPSVSYDGNLVLFLVFEDGLAAEDSNGFRDVLIRDRALGETYRVGIPPTLGQANGASGVGFLAPRGDWVVFSTDASNLESGDTNGDQDVYVTRFDRGIGQRYCTPIVANGTGSMGRIDAFGQRDASAGNLRLRATCLPPGQLGLFIAGRARGVVPTPVSASPICIAGPLGRFNRPGEIQVSNGAGAFELRVDTTTLPVGGGTLNAIAGDTWMFQAWHRTPTGSAFGSNLTYAVEVTFL